MSQFKLCIPTKEDMDKAWNVLPKVDRRLPISLNDEFHLADTHPNPNYANYHQITYRDVDFEYAPEDRKSLFRPILRAMGTTDLTCISEGTKIQMGAFFLDDERVPIHELAGFCKRYRDVDQLGAQKITFDPEPEWEGMSVTWVRCSDFLIADRPILRNISYSQLNEQGLIDGVMLNAPFEKAVSKMFFQQAISNPQSQARTLGNIMYDLTMDLQGDHSICADNNALYKLATNIYGYWLADKSDEYDLEDLILATSQLLEKGMECFSWKKEDADYQMIPYDEEDFSPEAVEPVLRSCTPDMFKVLLDQQIGREVDLELLDENGAPTSLGKTLSALREAEQTHEQVMQTLRPLDQKIKEAEGKRGPHEEPGMDQLVQDR